MLYPLGVKYNFKLYEMGRKTKLKLINETISFSILSVREQEFNTSIPKPMSYCWTEYMKK